MLTQEAFDSLVVGDVVETPSPLQGLDPATKIQWTVIKVHDAKSIKEFALTLHGVLLAKVFCKAERGRLIWVEDR